MPQALANCVIPAVAALTLAAGLQNYPSIASGIVRDEAGTPVAGVVVAARRPFGASLSDVLVLSRPTDSSGRFSFDNLGRGNYVFGVTISNQAAPIPPGAADLKPGAIARDGAGVTIVDRGGRTFVTIALVPAAEASGGVAALYAPAFHGGAGVMSGARLVQVDPERPRSDIDIVLPRKVAVRVAGVVTVALPSGFTDPGGPHQLVVRLMPADAQISPPRGELSDSLPIATTIAAGDGTFVFPAVPTGEYVIDAYRPMPGANVGVSSKGLPIITPPIRVDGDPQGMAMARPITLDGDVDQLGLTLRPSGPASRAALAVRGARGHVPIGRGTGGVGAGGGRPLPAGPPGGGAIAGRLTDANGAPIAGVQILAAQSRGNDLLPLSSPAITDSDGRYRLGGLAPGSYAVVVPSFVPRIGTLDPVTNAFPAPSSSGSGKSGYVTTFYPATADATRATLVEITGQERDGVDIVLQRVHVSDLAGAITGAPEIGFVFLLQDERRAQLGGRNVVSTRLAPGGKFLFRDVPDGRYTLSYESQTGWIRESIVLPDAANTGSLQLTPQPHVSISGRVMLDENAAASGATLPAGLSVRITPEQLTAGDGMTPGTVGSDGSFTIARVIPGRRYFMRAVTTPPWRQTAGSISGEDAFGVARLITAPATDARVVITNR